MISVEVIAKTPKSVVTSGVGHLLTILFGDNNLLMFLFKVEYSGVLISITDINECSSNPCLNGGSCTDQVNGYACSCQSGYAGAQCQTGKKYL